MSTAPSSCSGGQAGAAHQEDGVLALLGAGMVQAGAEGEQLGVMAPGGDLEARHGGCEGDCRARAHKAAGAM